MEKLRLLTEEIEAVAADIVEEYGRTLRPGRGGLVGLKAGGAPEG